LGGGAKSYTNPEITALHATLLVPNGSFGTGTRPIVFSGTDSVYLDAKRSWDPAWNGAKGVVENKSTVQTSLSDLTATGHEQLVEVETLEEVNPAVFTNVRNYVYDDIAILLPPDQRYDDTQE